MLKVIVCVDKNNAIGKKGELGFRLPFDLKNFQILTTDNVIVYGRKTLPSMGNKPLKDRGNIIISNDNEWLMSMSVNYDNILNIGLRDIVALSSIADVFICGGGEIYKYFMKHYNGCIDEYIITTVDAEIHGADTHFPMELFNKADFDVESSINMREKGYSYKIERFVRSSCSDNCDCEIN